MILNNFYNSVNIMQGLTKVCCDNYGTVMQKHLRLLNLLYENGWYLFTLQKEPQLVVIMAVTTNASGSYHYIWHFVKFVRLTFAKLFVIKSISVFIFSEYICIYIFKICCPYILIAQHFEFLNYYYFFA